MQAQDQADKMMDDFDRWAIRLLKVVVSVLLLAMTLMGIAWWLEPAPERYSIALALTDGEKSWINQRYDHHGINSSFQENGIHFFYRNGKRCRL